MPEKLISDLDSRAMNVQAEVDTRLRELSEEIVSWASVITGKEAVAVVVTFADGTDRKFAKTH